MIDSLRYTRTVLRHKWFVMVAGRRIGVSWKQLIVHDLSKFSRAEFGPYVRRFESGRAGYDDHSRDPDEFKRAFEHHWRHNPHHWEYWVDYIPGWEVPFQMQEKYALEMVADWMGAGRGYVGHWDISEWYESNRDRIKLHPETRKYVETVLFAVGFRMARW